MPFESDKKDAGDRWQDKGGSHTLLFRSTMRGAALYPNSEPWPTSDCRKGVFTFPVLFFRELGFGELVFTELRKLDSKELIAFLLDRIHG